MEHISSPRIGATCAGENIEDITAGLCWSLHCRNANCLQGMCLFLMTHKDNQNWNCQMGLHCSNLILPDQYSHILIILKIISLDQIFFFKARRYILPQRWEWQVHISQDRSLCYMGGETCSPAVYFPCVHLSSLTISKQLIKGCCPFFPYSRL